MPSSNSSSVVAAPRAEERGVTRYPSLPATVAIVLLYGLVVLAFYPLALLGGLAQTRRTP